MCVCAVGDVFDDLFACCSLQCVPLWLEHLIPGASARGLAVFVDRHDCLLSLSAAVRRSLLIRRHSREAAMRRLELVLSTVFLLSVPAHVLPRTAYLEAARGALAPGAVAEPESVVVSPETPADRRSVAARVARMFPSTDCRSWNEPDPFVTAVMPGLVGPQLWVGRSHSSTGKLGVDGLQKVYEIEGFAKVASPRQASFRINFPRADASVEQQCIEQLRGLEIRLPGDQHRGISSGDVWTLRITDISYGALADLDGPWTLDAATGPMAATFTMSEGSAAMALRKSAEHLWALPGSLALMVLWALAARILRALHLRRQAGTEPRPVPAPSMPQGRESMRAHSPLKDSEEVKPTQRPSRCSRGSKRKRR